MKKKNKEEEMERFHFVDEEEKKEDKKETHHESRQEKKDKNVNIQTLMRDSGEDTDTQLFSTREMEIIKENLKEERKDKGFFNNLYFGYKFRIALLGTISVVCLILGCICIIHSLNSTKKESVHYVENADATYKVCVSHEDPYLTNCIDYVNNIPTSDVRKIQINFDYLAKLEKDKELNLTYYVTATNRIYDKFDSSKKLYENEDIIVERTPVTIQDNTADLTEEYQLDFKKYNDFVVDYQSKYTISSEATLELVTYIDNGTETYEVGSINIPLGVDQLIIYKNYIKQQEKDGDALVKDWTDKSTLFVIIGCILILVALFAIVNLTKLVLVTINRKSKYEQKLFDLLTAYDRLIVEARGGYESDIVKKVIKVPTFEDLLDAREMLNKPIIFSKVNNVKSEFIVEDDEKLYKFVLKEADIEKEMPNK